MAEQLAVSSADTLKLIQPQAVIARAKAAVTAFIGRALKGPVNQAVAIHNIEDYRRVFGGLWQPSTLSYAIEQYFENGGEECFVVRVCNGGRAPTLRLAAGAEPMTLVGLAPGTRDFLRASVDYDGIGAHETDRFNLVIQRVRSPGSELVEEQEIFPRLSILPGAERNALDALSESRLMRVLGALPRQRPAPSASPGGGAGYTWCNADGDDGDPLSNYDIIGDASRGTGLFALRGAGVFNFLYVPPLTRDSDVGLPALLVALRLCRERQAMLLLDPPVDWSDAAGALRNLRAWPLFSDDALMFYPRVVAPDRLRGREEIFAPGATAAGLLAQMTARCPVWSAAADDELVLRAGARPAAIVTDLDRVRFGQGGINVLHSVRTVLRPRAGLRTLLPEAASKSEWRYASAKRLALFMMTSIEQGTRWALFEPPGSGLWAQLCGQVSAFFEALQEDGAFVGRTAEENYFVICDERLNAGAPSGPAGVQLLFGFAVSRPGDFHTCLVHHTAAGSSVRAVSVNRYALPRPA